MLKAVCRRFAMENRVPLVLFKLLIVAFLLASSHESENRSNSKSNAVESRENSNDSVIPKVGQILNVTADFHRHEIQQDELFGSVAENGIKKINGKLGFYKNDDIKDRMTRRHFKGESSMKSISSRGPDDIYQLEHRKVKRDTQTENQNGTEQSVVCEAPLLSCRNCCEGSKRNCTHGYEFCRCDPQCTFYNDCCVDYETFCGKKQQFYFGVDQEELSCIRPRNIDFRIKSNYRLWMVAKCPNERQVDEISQNCESADMVTWNVANIQKLIPVIDANNIVFRNEFCAKCNGIGDFERFGFNMKCYVVPPASIKSFPELVKFASEYCDLKYLHVFREANQPIRECNQYFRGVCWLTEVGKRCNQASIDRLEECSYCESMLSEWDRKCLKILYVPLKEDRIHYLIPVLTVVLRLSAQGAVSEVEKSNCDEGQFYDPYLETCRTGQLLSIPAEQSFDKFDVAVWLDVDNIRTDIMLTGRPNLNDFIFSLAQLFNFNPSKVTAIQDVTKDELYKLQYKIIRFQLQLTNEQTLNLGKENDLNNKTAPFGNNSGLSTNVLPLGRLLFFSGEFNLTVTTVVEEWNDRNKTYTVNVFKTTSRQLSCIRKQTYPKGSYIPVQNGDYYYINSTGETFAKRRVFFEGEVNDSISVCELVVFASCVGRRVNLTSDEYVKFDNLSIFYNRTETIYHFGEYDIEDGQIFMCIPEVTSKIFHRIPSDSSIIESYLTLTGFILSLTCLFVVILTFLLFPELRNLPGKNTLSLSISLFLVQLLWLIPDWSYPSTLCQIFAVVKHYLFLVSFVVMATIALDTYLVLGSTRVRNDLSSRISGNKKFYKYSAIAWGLPAVFVITCAVLDEKDIYAVYVNELLCWLDNVEAQEYLFVLPVGLLLLFNVALFTLTVIRIHRIRSTTRLVRSDQNDKKMFWIYLKLSTLMGFSWLFGFLYLFVETVVFSYLFVIFASLQGVYIFLAFVMKKDVWKKYKVFFGTKSTDGDHHGTLVESLSLSKETKV